MQYHAGGIAALQLDLVDAAHDLDALIREK